MQKLKSDLRDALLDVMIDVMTLLEETRGEQAHDACALRHLREASTVIMLRLMFLMEVERRGIASHDDRGNVLRSPLTEDLSGVETAYKAPGDVLRLYRELIDAARIKLGSGTIFSNRPNEGFGEDDLTPWLVPFDEMDLLDLPEETLLRWDQAMLKIFDLSRGLIDPEHMGVEHTHRSLGDVYEQILEMIPSREKAKGELHSKGELHLKIKGAKNERSALGAHYTPPEIVQEIVRPALGHIFEQRWEDVEQDARAYSEALLNLKVCDPAMGSAHFLTAAALEIAREIAWVEIHGEPRPFDWHEPMLHPNPIGLNPHGFDPDAREDDSDFALIVSPVYGGEGSREDFESAVKRHLPDVVQRCVYGVDVNPLACELGKLSLWLFTMTVQKDRRPKLTFLDGNIKCGNSLLGVTFKQAYEALKNRMGVEISEQRIQSCEALEWFYDLGFLVLYYKAKTKSRRCAKLVEALNAEGAMIPEEAKISYDWGRVVDELIDAKDERSQDIRDAIIKVTRNLKHHAFHWELAFPSVFPLQEEARGFDAIVANPPFVGDRKLRAFIGDEAIDFLKSFYMDGAVSDLCGFFFLRFDDLVSSTGVASSLATNTLAQAKNRREALVPLVTGDPAPFAILRARESERWPGDASVYICMTLLARRVVEAPRFLRVDAQRVLSGAQEIPISSYLDLYPEADFHTLPSMTDGICYTGHFLRGEFFLYTQTGQTLQEAIAQIPVDEQGSLYAYLNNRELQQQPRPEPSRIAIDFFDALEQDGLEEASPQAQLEWLRENRPTLLNQLETAAPNSTESVKDFRQGLPATKKNEPHRVFWWLFAYPRINLKSRLKPLRKVVAFGAVSKVWSPAYLPMIEASTGLKICPSHRLFISPVQETSFFAALSCFLFEAHMRREASTLETRVQVTPTDSLPVFPLPWKPTWSEEEGRPFITDVPARMEQALGRVVDELLKHRQEILDDPTTHGVPAEEINSQWGPTKLYNMYDDPQYTSASIQRLRELHEELLAEVLRAYGWEELIPNIQWGFDTPWIDRTTRYVPDLTTRRALFDRLAELNHERYKYELGLYIPHVVGALTVGERASWSSLKEAVRDAGVVISDDDLAEVARRACHDDRATFRLEEGTHRGHPSWTRIS